MSSNHPFSLELSPQIYLVCILIIIILFFLKRYFNGGVFNSPKIDLSGKYAVVTGGNSGIGAETVKFLSSKGCSVVIGARNKNTAQDVIKQCRKINPSSSVQYIELDLSSFKSIEAFSNSISFPSIDFLINNAGLMAIPNRKTTKEGLQMQWGVNHIGHFYLTYLLWNKITKSKQFRIVNVSALAHKSFLVFPEPTPDFQNINFERDYAPKTAYARSKLYNVLFTRALAYKINQNHGKVLSLHPGIVRTELLRQIKSGPFGNFLGFMQYVLYPISWLFTKNAWQGCQTTLYTLLSQNVENGYYYSDCKIDTENINVTQENWDKLWQISERVCKIQFNV